MKAYIGTKIVMSEPCLHYSFLKRMNRKIPIGSMNEPGYTVRYFDGYLSWSPKETFENCNRLLNDQEIRMIRVEEE